ncbi:MAG: hypothetical protein ACPKPY_12720 [Nitrososphaeraceae archaeon]
MKDKIAIISLADPISEHARMLHAFDYLFDLEENGFDASLFLDGSSVTIFNFMEKNPDDLIKPLYDKAIRYDYISQICDFCANAFSIKDQIKKY